MNKELNLYNKYRPKCLSEFIGQTTVKDLLIQSLKKQKNNQAFIFYGSHGIGKTSLARILAKMFNCPNFHEKDDVCNECKNCRLIDDFKTLDVCEVDAASNSGVDNMREIIQNSHYVPLDLDKKIYIIDEAHNLSAAAWNSLLKTIEEPPSENIIFLFLTTNINKIPETILSRCQKYSFSKFKKEELFSLIEGISRSENKEIEPDAMDLLSTLSQGSARECVTLMESIFLTTSNHITISDVERTFSLSNKKDLLDLLDHLLFGDLGNCNNQVEEFILLNRNLLNLFSDLLVIFMDLYLYEKTSNFSLLKKLTKEEAEKFVGDDLNLLKIMEILDKYINKYEYAQDKTSWAKILIFNLWEAIGLRSLETKDKPKKYIKPKKKTPPKTFEKIMIVKEEEDEDEEEEEEEKLDIEEKKEEINVVEEKKEIVEVKPKKSNAEVKKPKEDRLKKIPKDFHINLEIPKISQELEEKIIYGLHKSNLNKMASLENFEHFKNFIASTKPSKELLEIFKKIKPIENQILTTNKTIVVYFIDELDAFVFNELMKRKEVKEELENFFLKKYEWIGVSKEQLKHYLKVCKNKKASEITEEIFEKFETENLFKEVVGILEEP